MSPLQEHVRPLRYFLLQTVEQGDCGLDAMPFWDGSERTDKTWKALRLELAGALEAFAYDPCVGGLRRGVSGRGCALVAEHRVGHKRRP